MSRSNKTATANVTWSREMAASALRLIYYVRPNEEQALSGVYLKCPRVFVPVSGKTLVMRVSALFVREGVVLIFSPHLYKETRTQIWFDVLSLSVHDIFWPMKTIYRISPLITYIPV